MEIKNQTPVNSQIAIFNFIQVVDKESMTPEEELLVKYGNLIEQKILFPLADSEPDKFLETLEHTLKEYSTLRISLNEFLYGFMYKSEQGKHSKVEEIMKKHHNHLIKIIDNSPKFHELIGIERVEALKKILHSMIESTIKLFNIMDEFGTNRFFVSDFKRLLEAATNCELCVLAVIAVGLEKIWLDKPIIHDLLHRAYIQSDYYSKEIRRSRRHLVNDIPPPTPLLANLKREVSNIPTNKNGQGIIEEAEKADEEIFEAFYFSRRFANQWMDEEPNNAEK
jgi:hypothetical protein